MSVNKVILLGRVGKDPEIRYTANGEPVANFTLATNEKFTDRTNTRQERVEWHKIVVWGRQAEACKNYVVKGKQLLIEGKIQSKEWTDKEEQKRTSFEILATQVHFVSDGGGKENAPHPSSRPQKGRPIEEIVNVKAPEGGWMEEEDLPF